jgi:hypothetical protein
LALTAGDFRKACASAFSKAKVELPVLAEP